MPNQFVRNSSIRDNSDSDNLVLQDRLVATLDDLTDKLRRVTLGFGLIASTGSRLDFLENRLAAKMRHALVFPTLFDDLHSVPFLISS
jgi:hypothetical protein